MTLLCSLVSLFRNTRVFTFSHTNLQPIFCIPLVYVRGDSSIDFGLWRIIRRLPYVEQKLHILSESLFQPWVWHNHCFSSLVSVFVHFNSVCLFLYLLAMCFCLSFYIGVWFFHRVLSIFCLMHCAYSCWLIHMFYSCWSFTTCFSIFAVCYLISFCFVYTDCIFILPLYMYYVFSVLSSNVKSIKQTESQLTAFCTWKDEIAC
jgi:hypothetical protein